MTITDTMPTNDVPSIRDLLDAGTLADYLTETGTLHNVAEEVITNRRTGHTTAPRTDEEVRDSYDRLVGMLRVHGDDVGARNRLSEQYRFELTIEAIMRQIDAENLADEVEAALPAETVAYFTDQAEATLGREWVVELFEGDYKCSVTGEQRTGIALKIEPRWELDRDIAADSGATCPIYLSPDVLPVGIVSAAHSSLSGALAALSTD